MDQTFNTRDLIRSADVPDTRISEIAGLLGIAGRREGRTPLRFSAEDATRVLLVRRLQLVGVKRPEAAAAVRTLRFEDLSRIIATDAPAWLVRFEDGRAELCSAERIEAIAESRPGRLQGLAIVSVYDALRSVFLARAERQQAEAEASLVATCTAAPDVSGITLSSGLAVSIYRAGKGLRVQLSVGAARSLARRLEAAADRIEAGPAPEVVN